MTTLTFTTAVAADFQRIALHLQRHDLESAGEKVAQIMSAAKVLEHSPLLGRPARDDVRELIIGNGAKGYVLVYRYAAEIEEVFVLAVRSQHEVGYSEQ